MPSAILYLNVKKGYATTWDAYFFLQMAMQPFLYEILNINQISKPNASTMQMHKYAKNKIFLYFWHKWYVKATKYSTTPIPCKNSQKKAKKDTEIK